MVMDLTQEVMVVTGITKMTVVADFMTLMTSSLRISAALAKTLMNGLKPALMKRELIRVVIHANGTTQTGAHAVTGIPILSPQPVPAVLATVEMAPAPKLRRQPILVVMTALGTGPTQDPAVTGTIETSPPLPAALVLDLTE